MLISHVLERAGSGLWPRVGFWSAHESLPVWRPCSNDIVIVIVMEPPRWTLNTAPPPAVQTTADNLPTINTANHSDQHPAPSTAPGDETDPFICLNTQHADQRWQVWWPDLVPGVCKHRTIMRNVQCSQPDIQASNITVCYDLMWGYWWLGQSSSAYRKCVSDYSALSAGSHWREFKELAPQWAASTASTTASTGSPSTQQLNFPWLDCILVSWALSHTHTRRDGP